jgi:hypothetical protein
MVEGMPVFVAAQLRLAAPQMIDFKIKRAVLNDSSFFCVN